MIESLSDVLLCRAELDEGSDGSEDMENHQLLWVPLFNIR